MINTTEHTHTHTHVHAHVAAAAAMVSYGRCVNTAGEHYHFFPDIVAEMCDQVPTNTTFVRNERRIAFRSGAM